MPLNEQSADPAVDAIRAEHTGKGSAVHGVSATGFVFSSCDFVDRSLCP